MHKGPRSSGEYVNFLSDVAQVVARYVDAGPPPPRPSPEFTRQTLEVSAANELAIRAADAVVSNPGRRFNPLVIYGRDGVGKTHLLHAIGNGLSSAGGQRASVACVAGHTAVDEVPEALRVGAIERWRERYLSASALLIDDVQVLVGPEPSQQEWVWMCERFCAERRQLVLTSDRPLVDLPELEERLRPCVANGLVVEVQTPDAELREKLFSRHLLATSAERDPALARYLAARPLETAGAVAAVVDRLAAAAAAAGVPLTLGFVRAQLELAAPTGAAPATRSEPATSVDPRFVDRQRVVWDWPDVVGRAIEEWR